MCLTLSSSPRRQAGRARRAGAPAPARRLSRALPAHTQAKLRARARASRQDDNACFISPHGREPGRGKLSLVSSRGGARGGGGGGGAAAAARRWHAQAGGGCLQSCSICTRARQSTSRREPSLTARRHCFVTRRLSFTPAGRPAAPRRATHAAHARAGHAGGRLHAKPATQRTLPHDVPDIAPWVALPRVGRS